MDILFLNNDLATLCCDERIQNKRLGTAGAKKLRSRLADLDGGRRLVFVPTEIPPPARDDGSIDWHRVTRVRITFVGDYHD